jgi:glutamine synthetase
VDVAERQARSAHAERLVRTLVEHDVGMVATTFVDNAGITRVKSVPLKRLPELAAWGAGASTSFDFFRFDDWLAAPPDGTAPIGDLRIIPDLRRLVPLAAQPGWAWAPGDRYRQDGEPHDGCSRLLLQRLVNGAAGDGLTIKAAIEI